MPSIATAPAVISIMAARSRPSPAGDASRSRRCCRDRRAVDRHARNIQRSPPRSIAPSPSPTQPPFRRTRAVVVVKDGRVIAERYADGFDRHAAARLLRDQVGDLSADRHSGSPGHADAPAGAGRSWQDPAIRVMPSRSISCCATPRGSRSAARCRPRSAPRSSRSTA